jgi:glycosyltransferase involved in cell wall biosynthesis
MRVLCLDIEGGFGGSSRSLYQSLSNIDRREVAFEVWCRRDGPIRQRYEALGIPCYIKPEMPHVGALPRLSRNLWTYSKFAIQWLRVRKFRDELIDAAENRFDLIHFNHEGLFLLMKMLRRRVPTAPIVAHVRTMLPVNGFSRWQYRLLSKAADRIVFITENERDNLISLTGTTPKNSVIYNIAETRADGIAPHHAIPHGEHLKVAVLSNYAYLRGTDRLVEIAANLALRGRRDVLFVVAGDMTLRGSLPGELGRIARAGGTLADYVDACGLGDFFHFLGHVAAPEGVLKACDVLLRPSRDNAPWGRDVLEALGMGRPVVSIGQYDRFIETGVTGFLLAEYSADRIADILVELGQNRHEIARLGDNARARVASLCSGSARAGDLISVWEAAAAMRQRGLPNV